MDNIISNALINCLGQTAVLDTATILKKLFVFSILLRSVCFLDFSTINHLEFPNNHSPTFTKEMNSYHPSSNKDKKQ